MGLIDHLKSPDFGVFGVVLAIVLSILGNYATRFVDRGFQFGTSRLRAFSKQYREKRARKIAHLCIWIDNHENGAVLVLSEAHFLCFIGLTMVILTVGILLLSKSSLETSAALPKLLFGVLFLVILAVANAAMNTGGILLDTVRSHPKGLKGLNQVK